MDLEVLLTVWNAAKAGEFLLSGVDYVFVVHFIKDYWN